MNNLSGRNIGRYHILEQLGQGGMAVVYKAYDTRLERDVSFKLIRTDEIPASQHERLMIRFEREAKAQAGFNHPNIVPVFDYGQTDSLPYLVMAYISGGTLKQKLGQPVDLHTALGWLIPIADAIAYAHQNGVIHRDIKPSNILFQNNRPMLTDFGIAKLLNTMDSTLTGTGLGVGTPEYMAPEQWQGKPCEASDQYALGVVLYELITGQKPYTADTPAAVAIIQATEPLRPPSQWVQGIPVAVERVLYKALAKNPHDRFENMLSFNNALDVVHGGFNDQEIKTKESIPSQPGGHHSEAETIDIHEAGFSQTSHKPQAHYTSPQRSANKKPFPRWLLWGGVSLFAFMLVGMIIAAILGSRLFSTWRDKRGTQETIGSGVTTSMNITQTNNPQESTNLPTTLETATPDNIQEPETEQALAAIPSEISAVTEEANTIPTEANTSETTPASKDGAHLVNIPAGTFLMGSTEADLDWALSQSWCGPCQWDWFSNELPQHEVYLDSYWIYQTPVTNQQFLEFVSQTGYQTTAELQGWSWIFNGSGEKVNGANWQTPEGEESNLDGRQDHPVVHVSFQDAATYCQWAGGRLPTEAEWEKAGRGIEGQTFPWGEIDPNCSLANFEGCAERTLPADSHPLGASPYGIMDMVGNTWEWVSDFYNSTYYEVSPMNNPQGPASGDGRVIRGASWVSDMRYLRVTNRYYSNENDTSNDHGFRCVIEKKP